MKATLITLMFFFLGISTSNAQVSYSERVQSSSIKKETYNLFFIDFWATCCGPCSYATTHINQIRDKFPNELCVATMSQEQPDLISKYLKKHPNTIDVYSDAEGKTFKAHKINVLPSGILFNASGGILWKGNPADFSTSILSRFLRSNRKKGPVTNIFKKIEIQEVKDAPKYVPAKDFEIKSLGQDNSHELFIKPGKTHTYFEGSLKSILAHGYNVSSGHIMTSDKNMYSVYIKNDLSRFLQNLVLSKLKLKKRKRNEYKEALVFNVSEANLWDSNQINWGSNQVNYLLGDEDVEADNMTVDDFFKLIANALEEPYSIEGRYDKDTKHDWQIHYKYFEFLKSGLEDGFGVKVSKQKVKIPVYYISQK